MHIQVLDQYFLKPISDTTLEKCKTIICKFILGHRVIQKLEKEKACLFGRTTRWASLSAGVRIIKAMVQEGSLDLMDQSRMVFYRKANFTD